jgi:hypothetical protein
MVNTHQKTSVIRQHHQQTQGRTHDYLSVPCVAIEILFPIVGEVLHAGSRHIEGRMGPREGHDWEGWHPLYAEDAAQLEAEFNEGNTS